MRAVDLIRRKRDGEALTPGEIEFFVQGTTTETIPSYQVSALLMAVVWRGMSADEMAALTRAMTESGARLDFSGVAGVKVDKHSTGGVGDKTSPILAPLAAACGVKVPMVSGRGLGHTGGTLDKLEAIPGFRASLGADEMREVLARVGCCFVGQTATLAPADRVLYALRDATATVESVPLIAASIMSKKLAADLDGLVLDVTVGRGAFMKTETDARALAECLVGIGRAAGLRMRAMLTSMDAPRGRAVGNALEILECVKTLRGQGPADLEAVSLELAARMVETAGLEPTHEAAMARVRTALDCGAGLQKFQEIVAAQGGDPRFVDDPARLPTAPSRTVVAAERSGYLVALDAELVGRAAVRLGAGRDYVDQPIDHAVGAVVLVKPGAQLRAGEPVVELHYECAETLDEARQLAADAIQIEDAPPPEAPLVLAEVA